MHLESLRQRLPRALVLYGPHSCGPLCILLKLYSLHLYHILNFVIKTFEDRIVGQRPLCSVNEWLIDIRVSEHQKLCNYVNK